MNQNHSLFPNEGEWKQIDELTAAIESDPALSDPDTLGDSLDDYPPDEKDRFVFFAALQQYMDLCASKRTSMTERWAIEKSQVNWLAKLQDQLNAVKTAHERVWPDIQSFFDSLQSTIQTLSQRMVPAPVHRGAVAAKEQIYQPRRRALEPADLPAFSPLFCTAVDVEAPPFLISGLKSGAVYQFELFGVQESAATLRETLQATPQGRVEIDIAGMLETLQQRCDSFCEFVWFLSEENEDGEWTSGLVWRESKATRKLANDAVRVLMDSEEKERADSCIDALFEINLLSTREFFMQAYEEARQGLLFLPRQYREENSVPFKESLWLFINHLADKVIARLEKAEPVFRQVKPQWNAAESLRSLKERLKEWE